MGFACLRRLLRVVGWSLVWLTATHVAAQLCWAKPTREEIISYAAECKAREVRMDLIAKFGSDFSGMDLHGVDFRGYYCNRYETILRGANFSGSNLSGAVFGASILDGANFFGTDLEDASFITARLNGATFIETHFKNTVIRESQLMRATLVGADLSSSDISGSLFTDADLTDCVLEGAKNEYWHSDFVRANLTRADVHGLKLQNANFQGATLRSANFEGADLELAEFGDADLTDAKLKDANVRFADFSASKDLDSAQLAELRTKAQRWKYILRSGVEAFLRAAYFPTYLAVLTALGILTVRFARLPERPRGFAVAVALNNLAILPPLFLMGMLFLGGHPVRQLNSESSMGLWSTWCGLWPLFFLGLYVELVVSIILGILFLTYHWRWRDLWRHKAALTYFVLTTIHFLFATNLVGTAFPDA
jgi:uncharacterized protein YjbI with pentapeptide repeats